MGPIALKEGDGVNVWHCHFDILVSKAHSTMCISITFSMCGEWEKSTPHGRKKKFFCCEWSDTYAVVISREPHGPSKRIKNSSPGRYAVRVMRRMLILLKTCRIAAKITSGIPSFRWFGCTRQKPTSTSGGKSRWEISPERTSTTPT